MASFPSSIARCKEIGRKKNKGRVQVSVGYVRDILFSQMLHKTQPSSSKFCVSSNVHVDCWH